MTIEKEAGYVPSKQFVKPTNNTEKKGYVPPKLPAKPPAKKK